MLIGEDYVHLGRTKFSCHPLLSTFEAPSDSIKKRHFLNIDLLKRVGTSVWSFFFTLSLHLNPLCSCSQTAGWAIVTKMNRPFCTANILTCQKSVTNNLFNCCIAIIGGMEPLLIL